MKFVAWSIHASCGSENILPVWCYNSSIKGWKIICPLLSYYRGVMYRFSLRGVTFCPGNSYWEHWLCKVKSGIGKWLHTVDYTFAIRYALWHMFVDKNSKPQVIISSVPIYCKGKLNQASDVSFYSFCLIIFVKVFWWYH